MRLKSLRYSEFRDTPQEWVLEGLELTADVNLLVGKNASGKSRVINVIHNISLAIAGKRSLGDGSFDVLFDHEGKAIRYELDKVDGKVTLEAFSVNGEEMMRRGHNGIGQILAEKLKGRLEFQPPEDQLAIISRRDNLQHPFFEPIHQWARSVFCFRFGTDLGQRTFGVGVKMADSLIEVPDPGDPDRVVAIFQHGKKSFGEAFLSAVREDLQKVGYAADEVGLRQPRGMRLEVPGDLLGLFVRERDLGDATDQNNMSQGMFRALSLLVQVNHAILSGKPSCILIDDIGEGLDFERSCGLIDAVMSRARSSQAQLVMATNDRFVMNRVPLDNWSVLCRKGGRVSVRDYRNSREVFEGFLATGLSNFDFLALDYARPP